VAQTEWFFLPDIADSSQCRDAAGDRQQFMLSTALQSRIQFEAVVKVIFYRALAAACNDDDVFDPRRDGFFHTVLDDGLVNQRQHLLWDYFRGR